MSDEEAIQMRKVWELSDIQNGNKVQRVIKTVNQEMANPSMSLILPINYSSKEFAEKIIQILAFKKIPSRIVRALKLEEGKKTEKRKLETLNSWQKSRTPNTS